MLLITEPVGKFDIDTIPDSTDKEILEEYGDNNWKISHQLSCNWV